MSQNRTWSGGTARIRCARGAVGAFVAASVLLGVAGCGGGGAQPGGADVHPTRPQRKAYDPPTKFASKGVALPAAVLQDVQDVTTKTIAAPHVLLHGDTAWAATSQGLLAIDPATGSTRATFTPQHRSSEADNSVDAVRSDLALPQAAKVGGHDLVVQTFGVTIRGQGTTPDHNAIEVVAVDAGSARFVWRQVVELPKEFANTDFTRTDFQRHAIRTAVIGLQGTMAVVQVSGTSSLDGSEVGVAVVDLAARKAVWGDPGLTPKSVAAGQVAGVRDDGSGKPQPVQAKAVRDGSTTWSKDTDAPTVVAAGPELLLVQGLKGSGQNTVVGIATGKESPFQGPSAAAGTGSLSLPGRCSYDQRSVVVCGGDVAFGMDPHSGKVLWSLPDASGRIAPQVTGAWHGVVYGRTDNGPVVLDALTGKDKQTSPGAAPYWTDGRYAVTDSQIVPIDG
ncbi:hypothetical protein GCM10010211_75810 [Streptomyces albospinus]|uniref:Lipoprotein n=1 Tax=Streptomyces albospinus TaxID=285515 RepID=A0ABQ2VQD9_9ACTN|nr:hypothetical protein [Streptomyces albospinus]GGU97365.1 hypothetical protein GCM10010211_75810 [Streptomyces albospinus]